MKFQNKSCQFGFLVGVGLGVFLLAAPVSAKVKGQCAECHTMHNSQDGDPMAYNGFSADLLDGGQEAPNDVLLRKGCIPCHTGQNTSGGVIPFVNSTNEGDAGYGDTDGTDGTSLAGGNFWWVATDGGGFDAKGHNVVGLSEEDQALGTTPPGYSGTATLSPLTCAGANGCHGDRDITNGFKSISGSHHADDSLIDGDSVATSYRFLNGIMGLEDPGWEYQPSSTQHNQYKGVARSTVDDEDDSSISSLCAQCHDSFHNGTGSIGTAAIVDGESSLGSPWIRHPTDFDMGSIPDYINKEYNGYGGITSHTYQVAAPVASDASSLLSSVTFSGDTIVTCISCHRAHGTPYDDMLRWDYENDVEAGMNGSGACFTCHTTK